jgi:phage recombination protein Bet
MAANNLAEQYEAMREQGLTVIDAASAAGRAVAELRFSPKQVALLKRTIAKGTTDDEFSLFMEVAQRTGLNPFAKQIYAIKRRSRDGDDTMTIQTGVDGYRLIAQRTGEYAGQRGPQWCGADGEWRDVWLEAERPAAARVGVFRTGFVEPVWGVATTASYMPTYKDGNPIGLWGTMADVLIAKCAEVLALRKAFPQELSGLYADVELDQADTDREPPPPPVKQPTRQSARKSTAREGDFIEGESREVSAPKDEPAISRFWRDVRAMAITRDQVVEHLGHEAFETLDDDALGELVIQLRDKFGKSQPGLGV